MLGTWVFMCEMFSISSDCQASPFTQMNVLKIYMVYNVYMLHCFDKKKILCVENWTEKFVPKIIITKQANKSERTRIERKKKRKESGEELELN